MSNSKISWYNKTPDAIAKELDVDTQKGLTTNEIQKRQERYGVNALKEAEKESKFHAFLRQYKDYMQIVLVIAAIMSYFVGDYATGNVLLLITIANAFFALKSERKAEESVAALRKMLQSTARVRRDGKELEIPTTEVVVGDIVLFESGDRVPADGRLIVAQSLEIEESTLTGESSPVQKNTDTIKEGQVTLAKRLNMAFMHTNITRGRGEMIVTAIGMDTQIGKIAQMLQDVKDEKSPLQKQVDSLTIVIAIMAACAFVIMFIIGLSFDMSFGELYSLAIVLAIASLPSALPVVVTTTLALGTREMAKKGAIVKKLPAVETLGSTSAICSDKTGTLTLNKMTARSLIIAGNRYDITGKGYETEGKIMHIGGEKKPSNLDPYFLPMALCTDAVLKDKELIGDPTEGALIVLAEKGGMSVTQTRKKYPRIAEVPFDSSYKLMATFHKMKNEEGNEVIRCYIKGGVDILTKLASHIKDSAGQTKPLTDIIKSGIEKQNNELAGEGMRVLAVAQKDFDIANFDADNPNLIDTLTDITLLAMVGIIDPPRPQVRDAIAKCKDAGIQVRMITGDHVATAKAIAEQLNIPGKALSGEEFANLTDDEITEMLDEIGVIARVTPKDKIRLITLLQKTDKIVAMTGDGVNDAPALKKADIGIAMGITGTDVSKEAAVMILTDDNFTTIVKAVEYGRVIYDNLLKFIRFQLATLSSFIISFTSAAAFGVTLSLFAPLQIIFIKFFVTGVIGIAFAFDKPNSDTMKQRPRKASKKIVSWSLIIRLLVIGTIVAIFSISAYKWAFATSQDVFHAQTIAMVMFAFLTIPFSLNLRNPFTTIFTKDLFSNRRLLMAYGWIIAIMTLITASPMLNSVFNTTPLTTQEWQFIILAVILFFAGGEIFKLIFNLIKKGI